MMSMSLVPALRMGCLTCGGYSDEHAKSCPAEAIEEVLAKEFRYQCPKCHGVAGIDLDDVISCKKCRTRFSRGLGQVANPDHPDKTIIHQVNPAEDYIEVLVLAAQGTKPFKTDVIIARLREEKKTWRRRLRDEKAASRVPKRRHSRSNQTPCPICGPLFCRYAP